MQFLVVPFIEKSGLKHVSVKRQPTTIEADSAVEAFEIYVEARPPISVGTKVTASVFRYEDAVSFIAEPRSDYVIRPYEPAI